jgi:hypothetical protein
MLSLVKAGFTHQPLHAASAAAAVSSTLLVMLVLIILTHLGFKRRAYLFEE